MKFVPYPLSLIAKEKGFNQNVFYRYDDYGTLIRNLFIENSNRFPGYISAPLYHQIVDFLHTKNIHVEIYYNGSGCGYILTKMNGTTIKEITDDIFFKDDYQAYDVAFQEAFKLI